MTKLFSGLRQRLILLVLLAVLPALSLILYTNLEQRDLAAADAQVEALRLARLTTAEEEQLIQITHQLLIALAQLPVVRAGESAACSKLFANLVQQFPAYGNLGAAGLDGDIYCSGLSFSGSINIRDRGYFQRAIETNAFAVGDYQIGRITGKPGLNFGYPLHDDTGQVQGVVFIALDLGWLNRLLAQAELPPGSTFSLIDHQGVILARQPDSEVWVGRSGLDSPLVQLILAQGEGFVVESGLDGVRRLYAFIPLASAAGSTEGGEYVSIGFPTEAIFTEANRMLVRNLALLGLVTTVAFIAAWLGGDLFLLRQIKALREATKRLAAGDLTVRTGLSYGSGELNQVAHAFDRMAEALELRETKHRQAEEELKQRATQLALINNIGRQIAATLELTVILNTAAHLIQEMFHYHHVALFLIEDEALKLKAVAGSYESYFPPGHTQLMNQGINGWVASHGEKIVANDVTTEPCYISLIAEHSTTQAELCLPIKIAGQTVGVLDIQSPHLNTFGENDIMALETLSDQVAVAIENARLVEAIQQELNERKQAEQKLIHRNRELELLNAIIAASTSGMEPETILETACRQLALAFNLPQATAVLLNKKKTEAQVVAEYRVESRPAALNQTILVAGNPAYHYLLSRQASLVVEDVQTDPHLVPVRELLRQGGIAALLMFPLVIKREVVGVLGLEAAEPRRFSPEEVSLAWSIADQVAGSLARARLDQERRLLSTAIEQTTEGVVLLDPDQTIRYVNPAFEQMTGYSRVEAIGQNLNILNSGKHEPAFFEEIRATITAGQVWQGRIINRKKDGSLYTDETVLAPVRNEHGEIVNYVELKRDVTQVLQLEEQYRQAQKMEAIGHLTGGIAHDFNNLLTAINGFAELLQARLPPDSPFRGMVDNIVSPGQRAAELVGQLLTFSRKQIIDLNVLDLNTVVGGVDKMLQRIIGEDVTLTTLLAPDLWPVKADSSQLEQVILNLAVNARDAMPHGGQLTIETANVVLDEAYISQHLDVRPDEYVLLAVSDTGTGMSQDVQAHIFEPFFTTKEKGKGTGLGLATIFGIVKQSGGDIRVYSEPGQGTTFKIYLPRTDEAAADPTLRESDLVPYGTETLLLVEDDPNVLQLVREVLQELGYTLLAAADAQVALTLADRYTGPLHLLLTDVIMPGLNGKALADQLTQSYPDLKVLFMSGYTDDAIVHHGVLEPDTAFIQKPFAADALARKVREVLDKD